MYASDNFYTLTTTISGLIFTYYSTHVKLPAGMFPADISFKVIEREYIKAVRLDGCPLTLY
jgi:hypothetical protein